MLTRVLLSLALALSMGLAVHAQQQVAAQASLIVPPMAVGSAEIPLVYDLNNKALLFLRRSPTCIVNYEQDGLNFVFTVPTKPNYKPKGLEERDGNIFGDDRVELYLKTEDASPYGHYAINVVGTIADAKIHDRTWNGTATYDVSVEKDCWKLQIKIPFSDFGFDLTKSSTLKALVAVYSGDPANSFYSASVTVPVDFAGAAFQTLVLSPTLPFVEKVRIGEVAYDLKGHGSFSVDYQIKNPTGSNYTLEAAKKTIELPGNSSRTVSDKFALGAGKISQISLSIKDILNVPMELKNDVIPRIDLVALDWHTISIKLYNQKSLAPYVKDVVVLIDKKKRLQCPLAKLPTCRIDLRYLKPGPHEVNYLFLNKTGTEFTSQTKTVNVFEPNPVPGDISKLDFSRYYKPVTFESDKVSFTRSRFDLSKGILPNQIEVDSRGILDQPVQLVFDGKALPTGGKIKVISSNKNALVLRSISQAGDKTLTVTADHRYDGFTWYDVELSSKKPFEYGPLSVVVPLKLDDDILLSHDGTYPDNLFKKSPSEPAIAPLNSQLFPHGRLLKPNETTSLSLTSYVGLATDTNEEYRGLFVSNEGPSGWNVRNYDQTYKIQRDAADRATLSLRISDGQTRWKRKSIKFGFALIPVPLRNDIKDFHGYYRVDCNNNRYAYEANIPSATGEKTSYMQNLNWNGVKITLDHEAWSNYESYWVEAEKDFRTPKYVAAAKENGLKTIAYFGFLISNMIPEFPLYHDLFLAKPSDYPNGGFMPYLYQLKGDPEQAAFGVCYNSEFGDFFARGIAGAVRHYDWNGIFFDGGLGQLGGCANVKHGCSTVDPYGRLIFTFPVRKYRKLMEYVYSEGIKKDPEFIIDNHVNWPNPPLMGLISAYWTTECSIFFDPQSRTDPEALRAMLNAKLYGVPCDLLRRPETPLETTWAQGLLVDAYPRSVALGYGPFSLRMWGLYDKYGLTSDTFTPFFSKKSKVVKDNSTVLVSYYDTAKALVVVVSNYWSEKPQSVTVDLSAFAGLSTKCNDAWSNVDFELIDNKATMTIDPMWLRLLVIEKR